jgi:hypothetical protein
VPNTLSDVMANAIASPPVRTAALAAHGAVYSAVATAQIAATHLSGRIYPLLRLPASVRLVRVSIGYQNLGGAATGKLGIYQSGDWSQADQSPKDDDVFDGSLPLTIVENGASFDPQLIGFVAGVVPSLYLWQYAGDTTPPRPGTTYDICLTLTANVAAAGAFVLQLEYCPGT